MNLASASHQVSFGRRAESTGFTEIICLRLCVTPCYSSIPVLVAAIWIEQFINWIGLEIRMGQSASQVRTWKSFVPNGLA